ncbi:polysaccharide biosynthesis tyrosine autokinase [Glaciimonas sp. PCH181]|uniref:polysaccharide biosynthesis tyrosine autokinase n=1 Tax=Glaciimonas sp. PCH181 TaxID=2133943 RepID=UPI000D35E4E9|nr:polysaccharide biosynthesis tyrosine autokinase [Glaciimonas sp. PCH181]PUA16921.1 tyrosine protein kinase [Glaciimonas sp. PCH181]
MNKPIPQPVPSDQDDDQIDLATYLDVLYDHRWLIIGITLVITLIGVVMAFTKTPIYQANMVLQVEDTTPKSGSGDMSAMFQLKAAAPTEIEILRTRMVVSHAVDNLQLNLSVQPKYFPYIGTWIASRNSHLSQPGLFGYGGYAWGTENIKVSTFTVPANLQGAQFTLIAQDNGQFRLTQGEHKIDVAGRVGVPVRINTAVGPIDLKVESLAANAGAEFLIMQRSRLAEIKSLQMALGLIEVGRDTGIINATLEGANPGRTAIILNEIGRQYLFQNVERKSEEAEKSLVFLNQQLPEVKRKLELSQSKYTKFRNSNGSISLSDEASSALEQSATAQAKLIEATQKRAALLVDSTPEHPSVKALDNEIRGIKEEISDSIAKVKTLPLLEQDLLRLELDVKVNTDLYTNLLSTSQQLRLVKAGKVGNARLLDPAVTPELPIGPNRLLIVGAALIAGLFLGVVIAFLRKTLYGGVDDAEEIERTLGLTVYATIPHSKTQQSLYQQVLSKSKQISVLAHVEPTDTAVESLRSLRTALQFSMLGSSNNVIMITGATPGIGKSFISTNFAAILAANGKRVVLVDADLRKGYLHQYFGLGKQNGLSELIAGSNSLEKTLHRDVVPDVDFISTGNLPPNASDLLLHPNFSDLLKSLEAHYDYVLIDTPPILAVSDPLIIASLVGSVFLVVRAGDSTTGEIKESIKRLSTATNAVKGVIFNDVKVRPGGYGYNYKYGKYRQAEYAYGK